MTVVGAAPISLRDATLTVASDDYSAAVNEVRFEPRAEWVWAPDLTGPGIPVLGAVRWTLVLGVMQDLATGSLSRYLLANAGATKTMIFTVTTGGPTVTASVVVVPLTLGGPSGQILTSSPELPVVGAPVVA